MTDSTGSAEEENVIFQRHEKVPTTSNDVVTTPGMEGDDAILRCFELSVNSYNTGSYDSAMWSTPSTSSNDLSALYSWKPEQLLIPEWISQLETEKSHEKDSDKHPDEQQN